jgi:anti-anti-sigma factor
MQLHHGSGTTADVVFLADVGSSEGHALLRLIGELDMGTADAAVATAERALQHVWRGELIVDLAEVSFCDSMGIRALSHIADAAREQDRAMVLRGPQPSVRRVLQIAGFDAYFEVAADTTGPPVR